MKINEKLIKVMKEKNIHLNVSKYIENESKLIQSNVIEKRASQQQEGQNIRVRPLSAAQKKELYMNDMMSTATSFNQKKDPQIQESFQPQVSQIQQSKNNMLQSFYNKKDLNQSCQQKKLILKELLYNICEFFFQIQTFNFLNFPFVQINSYISQETLEEYFETTANNLSRFRQVEIRFDSSDDSLQLLGEIMPNITHFKLNNSIMNNLRDLGTSMQNLKILWISRSNLTDLSGINALPQLAELYANYNNITELNDLYYNQSLEILDIEGNDILDIENIEVLETVSTLNNLNLTNNPVLKNKQCLEIIKRFTQLQIFNDFPFEQISSDQPVEIPYKLDEFYDKIGDYLLTHQEKMDIEKQIREDPNDEDLILLTMKKKSKKVQQQKQEETKNGFYGNALKVIKHKRKNDNENDNFAHKDILKLLDTYAQDDNQAYNLLLEELNQIGKDEFDLQDKIDLAQSGIIDNYDNVFSGDEVEILYSQDQKTKQNTINNINNTPKEREKVTKPMLPLNQKIVPKFRLSTAESQPKIPLPKTMQNTPLNKNIGERPPLLKKKVSIHRLNSHDNESESKQSEKPEQKDQNNEENQPSFMRKSFKPGKLSETRKINPESLKNINLKVQKNISFKKLIPDSTSNIQIVQQQQQESTEEDNQNIFKKQPIKFRNFRPNTITKQ